jgi:hypothetical protein
VAARSVLCDVGPEVVAQYHAMAVANDRMPPPGGTITRVVMGLGAKEPPSGTLASFGVPPARLRTMSASVQASVGMATELFAPEEVEYVLTDEICGCSQGEWQDTRYQTPQIALRRGVSCSVVASDAAMSALARGVYLSLSRFILNGRCAQRLFTEGPMREMAAACHAITGGAPPAPPVAAAVPHPATLFWNRGDNWLDVALPYAHASYAAWGCARLDGVSALARVAARNPLLARYAPRLPVRAARAAPAAPPAPAAEAGGDDGEEAVCYSM